MDAPLRPDAARRRDAARGADAPRRRGRLRVYAGMCEGAGATHRMLAEGERLRAAGEDVVLGVLGASLGPAIEELAAGLERISPASIVYRGVAIEELDVEAAVARRPAVVLVDELWREAPPGMRPATRWAAVDLLRDEGVDVLATLDLGHLASLADAAQTITGAAVRERLPDAVLDDADDVELVDASPDTLRQRIADGLVVSPERVALLLDHVYTRPNLAALRLLSLRCLARRVEREFDADDADARRTPAGSLAVLVDGGPGGREAIRRGAALAAALHLRLVAVAPGSPPSRGGAALDALADDDLRLARDLGAEVVAGDGGDLAELVAATAVRVRAGHVVLPVRTPSLSDRLRGRSLAERLAATLPSLEIHLVPERGGGA